MHGGDGPPDNYDNNIRILTLDANDIEEVRTLDGRALLYEDYKQENLHPEQSAEGQHTHFIGFPKYRYRVLFYR